MSKARGLLLLKRAQPRPTKIGGEESSAGGHGGSRVSRVEGEGRREE